MYRLVTLGNASFEQDGRVLDRIVGHRRAFALLAVVSAEGRVSRERLATLLWPDSDDERARGSLKQALHWIRRELNAPELIVGSAELRLNPQLIESDVASFKIALEEGDFPRAVELYRGPFLDGLHVGNGDFEGWVSAHRQALAERYRSALASIAHAAETRGDYAAAVQWWRRLQASEPLDSRIAVRLMVALAESGSPAGALAHARVHETMLREELGIGLPTEANELLARLRQGRELSRAKRPEAPSWATPSSPLEPARGHNENDASIAPTSDRRPPIATGQQNRRRWALATVVTAGLVTGFALFARLARPADERPSNPAGRGGPAHAASTRSAVAGRLYEQGQRAFYRADWRGAYELFAAAFAEDSTFAIAAHYAGMSQRVYDADSSRIWIERSRRLADQAPERDRLLIRLAQYSGDYSLRLAVAETLTARFPSEAEGHLALASLRADAGDFLTVVPHARHVIALDSLSLHGNASICRACDAYVTLVHAYLAADSLAAAERTAHEWTHRQPASADAWIGLVEVYGTAAGIVDSAESALLRAEKLRPVPEAPYVRARFAIRVDDDVAAERQMRTRLRYDAADVEALWLLMISLRNQGRMRDALAVAELGQRTARDVPWAFAEAQAHFELGQFRQAAAQFDSIAHILDDAKPPVTRGALARHVSWASALSATAHAASGDTARLQSIADSIESIAHLSAYGRDWHLPYYVRGLLWLARNNPDRAVQSFRAAVFSPTRGYTRTNLELARGLLLIGRANEAIYFLQAALRGPPDGSNYYVTRTELHELLAQSFQHVNRPDSARVHYSIVVSAWSHGDPDFRIRAEQARKALSGLVADRSPRAVTSAGPVCGSDHRSPYPRLERCSEASARGRGALALHGSSRP